MNEIRQALSDIKSIGDLIESAQRQIVDTALREKADESQTALRSLNSILMNLQAQSYELLNENQNLKTTLSNIEDWVSLRQMNKN